MTSFHERRDAYQNKIRISVTGKIVAAYLLLALFSLVAIIYALSSLHRQTTLSRHLVDIDIRAAALARELQAGLLAQERLEKQFLLLKQSEVLGLLRDKYAATDNNWQKLVPLLNPVAEQSLGPLYVAYTANIEQLLTSLETGKPLATQRFYKEIFLPRHLELYDGLKDFRDNQMINTDTSLAALSDDSKRAYEITLLLLLLGLALATPVAISVILGIHRSLRRLTEATHKIAAGNYDLDIDTNQRDEFGQLTLAFLNMGRMLREVQAQNLDANPLTHLPGNLVIQQRVEALLQSGTPFAHAFVDLDNFKVYGDRYGYQKGSNVISMVADLMERILQEEEDPNWFIGHIGGDDYVFLINPDRVEPVAKKIIDQFDQLIPSMYSEADRSAGSFIGHDRFDIERRFELMTISIAIICSDTSRYTSAAAFSHECAKMKEHLKRLPGSNYLIDRRKGLS